MTFSEGNKPTHDREAVLEEVGRALPDLDSWTKDGLWGNRLLYEVFGGEELLSCLHQISEVAQSYPRETRIALSIQGETLVSKDEKDKYDYCRNMASERYRNVYGVLSETQTGLVGSLVDYLRLPKEDRQPLTTERIDDLADWTAPLVDRDSLFLLGVPINETWDQIIEGRLEKISSGHDRRHLRSIYFSLLIAKGKGYLLDLVDLDIGQRMPSSIATAISNVSQRETISPKDQETFLVGYLKLTRPSLGVTPGVYQVWGKPFSGETPDASNPQSP